MCKSPNPSVEIATNGTMVTVTQNCRSCGPMKRFNWMSQPVVIGRQPAGNLLSSFGTITSGVNISQKMMLFKHKGLSTIWFMHMFLCRKRVDLYRGKVNLCRGNKM